MNKAVWLSIFLLACIIRTHTGSYLLVPYIDGSTSDNGKVNRYDAPAGNFIGVFVATVSEDQINGLTQGPDGNFYVSSFDTRLNTNGRFLRFDGSIGNPTDTSIQPGPRGLLSSREMVFGPWIGKFFT